MNNRRNYYRILQVQPDAPQEIIRASYRTLMKELKAHPDVGGEHASAYLINEAYETLSDRARRAEYDKKLRMRPAESSILSMHKLKPDNREKRLYEKNQRSCKRIKRNGELHYSFSRLTPDQKADMLDLSPKGVRFLCSEELKQESRVRIKSPILKADAKIVNSRKTFLHEKMYYAVGAEFLNVSFRSSKGTFFSASV
jgi:curved DNA-binding protein CbpA